MPNVQRAKCVIIGDSMVGKTAVTQAFLFNGTKFPKNYIMTCGVDLNQKTVNIPDTDDIVELYLYDSSGKDVYTEFIQKIFKEPYMVCIVYDVTMETSLANCDRWFRLVKQMATSDGLPGIVLANKTDLQDRRVVSPKSGQDLAKTLKFQYFECSAKEMQGVEEPFFYLANEWHKLNGEKKRTADSSLE